MRAHARMFAAGLRFDAERFAHEGYPGGQRRRGDGDVVDEAAWHAVIPEAQWFFRYQHAAVTTISTR